MSDLRQAARIAQDWMEYWLSGAELTYEDHPRLEDDVQALRDALAQPEQEPVAWRWSTPRLRGLTWHYTQNRTFAESQPLYTHPPQRKPLTEDEIAAIGRELGVKCRLGGNPNIDFDYARAIEKAHGIGGEHD